MLAYGFAPLLAATLIAFGVLWVAHARALKFAGTGLSEHPLYAWISSVGLLFLGYLIAAGSIETWTVVRYLGARGIPPEAKAWHDSVFGLPLKFYLFDLPFYSDLRGYLLALVIVCVLVYWIAARGWQLRYRLARHAATCGRSIRRSSAWKADWKAASCAARWRSSCWRWRCASSWRAMRWSTTSTDSWWASITWT